MTKQNAFYEAVKQTDSSIQVVLGGFSTFSMRALAASKGLITSFYVDDGTLYDQAAITDLLNSAEGQAFLSGMGDVLSNALYDEMKTDNPGKSFIVTEFGGPNTVWEAPYSDAFQAERFLLYVQALTGLDALDFYYFTPVEIPTANHPKSGLIDQALNEKPVYNCFKIVNGE